MKFLTELIVCFLMGGIPCLMAFSEDEVKGVENYLKSIDTSDTTVMYFLVLAAVHFALSFMSKIAPRYYDGVKNTFIFILPVANDVGSCLLCLYRIIAGASLGCVVIVLSGLFEHGNLLELTMISWAGAAFFFMSYFIARVFNYAMSIQRVGI